MSHTGFEPTEDQIEQFYSQYGGDDGQVEPEQLVAFMAGEIELEDVTDGDTAEEEQDAADTSQEASQASDEDQGETVADTEKSGSEAADQKDEAPDDSKPDGILAKDGKNVIPFSALEEVRTELDTLKSQNEELKKLLEARPELEQEAVEAAAQDEEAGDTKATEAFLEKLDENLEEDYPGITDRLKQELAPIFDKLNKIDELIEDKVQRDTRTEAEVAQDQYNEKIQELEPRYVSALNEDSKDFWTWFDAQPSYVRAAENSGVPEHFAEVVKSFYDQREEPAAEQTEKRTPKADAKDVKESVDKAKEKADAKDSVPSLSSLPGGKNPEHDENEAILNMSPMELADKLDGMSPEQIEEYMRRVI